MREYLIVSLLILTSCYRPNKIQDDVQKLKDEISQQGKVREMEVLAWYKVIDSIESMGQIRPIDAIQAVDHLLESDSLIARPKISELYFLKGDLFYKIDSFERAVDFYSFSNRGPKGLAARAGALIKFKDYRAASDDLKYAAEINYDYLWNLGNYFEIVNQKDSAIFAYQELYQKDTVIYKRCKERIEVLNKPSPKYLTELVFYNRGRMTLILK